MKGLIFVLLLAGVTTIAQCVSTTAEVCKAVRKCSKVLNKGGSCPIMPIPKKSILLPAPEIRLTSLRKGVWLYDDGAYLSLILKLGDRLALLDMPDSAGSNKPDGSTRLIDAVEEIMKKDVPKRIDMVYSHSHYDHIGAATRVSNYFKATYPKAQLFIWGTEEAKELIEDSVTKRAVVPNVIVGKAGATLSLGKGLSIKMIMVGGHTFSDLALFIPRHKKEPPIVMLVDFVFPGWSPPFDLAITVNVGKYIAAHRKVLDLDFELFVGGHNKLGDRKDVVRNLRYAEDLVDASREATASITDKDLAEAGIANYTNPDSIEYGNIWFVFFDVIRKLEIDACYRIMFPKWGCKLAGLDFALRGHCFTAITWVLTDY